MLALRTSLTILVITFGILTSPATCSTLEDAQRAFGNLSQYGNALINNINTHIRNLNNKAFTTLYAIENATITELHSKLEQMEQKASQILTNAESIGVDITRCRWSASNDIEQFRSRMESRIRNCTQKTVSAINDAIFESYLAIGKSEGNTLGCNSRSVVQCSKYEVNNSCFDVVIGSIEKARVDMGTTFAALNLTMTNRVESFKLPCSDLIGSQLAVYPNLVLNHVIACVNTHSKLMVPEAC